MASNIDKDVEVYDNTKKYAVSNYSPEDFEFKWGGEPFTIKAGEVEVYPQYLAFHATKHLTDREMFRDGKEGMTSIPGARDMYEVRILTPVAEGADDPRTTALRAKIRKELEAEMAVADEPAPEGTPEEKIPAVKAASKAVRNKKVVEAAIATDKHEEQIEFDGVTEEK